MSATRQAEIRRRNNPRSGPNLRRAERTRQAILDAALEILWTQPFRDLTVESLMAQTGSSRSAFYQYFADLHDLMKSLLHEIQGDILSVAQPWLEDAGDPVPLLRKSLSGLVDVCYRQGPIVRAVSDAASTDETLETAWADFLKVFDQAIATRIKQQQAAGLMRPFDAYAVTVALNRMNASLMIQQFGRRPRGDPEIVRDSITQVWVSTLYGAEACHQNEQMRAPGVRVARAHA